MTIDQPKHFHRALWKEAFGDNDDSLDIFERTAFSPKRSRCVIIDGTAAAALYWFDCSCRGQRVAYIYAVATAKAYRGQGLCTALMEDTHRHLKKLGYTGAVLVPSSDGLFKLYGKMGYKVCSSISEISCEASEKIIEIRKIDTEEYAMLRLKFLPEGSVIQEGENLSFLNEEAELYTGEGFLLTAEYENNILYGKELLGDTQKAPHIVNSLGFSRGFFRVQGDGRPFAMYFNLSDKIYEPPAYFGLAFD